MKFLDDMIALFRIKQKEKRRDEEEPVSDSVMTDEDQHPGQVSLTDGEHGKPFVINNKIVKAAALGVVFLLVFVFFVKQQKPAKTDTPNAGLEITQEAADPARTQITNKEFSSYDALLAANRRAGGVGGGVP